MSNNQRLEVERIGSGAADGLVIRLARADDAVAVSRLAALDSQRAPAGALLLAEMAGELWAALPLDGGPALADPFRPAAEVVDLLRVRAAQLRQSGPAPASAARLPRLLGGLTARARA
jgi:hypothetical protein